jgi:hypothetical protein
LESLVSPASGVRNDRNIFGQCCNVTLKRHAKAAQQAERNILLSAFDAADVRAIHIGDEGQLVLRQAEHLSARPDPLTKLDKDRFFHRLTGQRMATISPRMINPISD